jgi:hypothetical protein
MQSSSKTSKKYSGDSKDTSTFNAYGGIAPDQFYQQNHHINLESIYEIAT